MPTAAEIFFQIRADGISELEKVATVVGSVAQGTRLAGDQLRTFDSTLKGLVGSGKSLNSALQEMAESQGVLSGAVRGTARELLLQRQAAEGDEAAIKKLSVAHQQLTGNVMEARVALQALDGQFSSRGAARWLAQIQGIAPILSGIFNIAAPLAFAGIIDQMIEKVGKLYNEWDPVVRAQNRALESMKALNAEYEKNSGEIQRFNYDAYERKFGKEARYKLEANDSRGDAKYGDQARIDEIGRRITEAQSRVTRGTIVSRGAVRGQTSDAEAAQVDIRRLQDELFVAQNAQKKDLAKAGDFDARAQQKEDKSGESLAAKRARAEVELRSEIARLQERELKGVAAVNAELDRRIEKLKAENLLTGSTYALEVERAQVDLSNRTQDAIRNAQAGARRGIASDLPRILAGENLNNNYFSGLFTKGLAKDDAQLQKDINANNRVLQRGDDTDADAVKRQLEQTVKGNALRSNGGGGSGAIQSDYQARLTAAKEIYEIETRHLDLINDEDKRLEKQADARKKYADEIYQAEAQNQEALAALREKDLQSYQSAAEKLFDAATNRKEGGGFALRNLFRGEAMSTARTIVGNVAGPVLQSVGNSVIGAIPAGLGGILKGTAIDPARVANDPQSKIEKNTADSSNWLKAIYQKITGKSATDGTAAAADSGGSGGSSQGILPDIGVLGGLASIAAVAGVGGGGTASAATGGLFGSLSKLFGGSGASGGGIDLAGVLTGVGSGPGGNGAQSYSTADRIQGGIGEVTALATGGLAIASGISKGGVSGDLKAAGGAAGVVGSVVGSVAKLIGAASPLLSAIPIIGSIAAAALPLIGSLFGTGPAQREKNITNELAKNQFLLPTALNVTQGPGGNYEDFDAHGNLRTSTLSAVPTVSQPYITSRVINGQRVYATAPGQTLTPYSGTASGSGQAPISNAGGVIVQIAGGVNAISPSSFNDVLQHPQIQAAVGNAVKGHIQSGAGGALTATIAAHI